MAFNIHAGHTKSGTVGSGAKSILDESVETRKVKKALKSYLEENNYKVYDCTNDKAASERDNLIKIVEKCNAHNVGLDISIHFNSGAKDKKGDGKSCGCEVWICPGGNSIKKTVATNICKNLAKLGFKNRGVKYSSNLYVLNHTNAPAVLVECCFVDDKDDADIYKKVGYKKVAEAIGKAMMVK